MTSVTVRPKAGARVINPATGTPLPADGARVELSAFWLRREADDEVTIQRNEPKKAASGKKDGGSSAA